MKPVIEVDDDAGLVTINGVSVSGWLTDDKCKVCSHELVYHDDCDATFCPVCNEWKEWKCWDPGSNYCREMPRKPL